MEVKSIFAVFTRRVLRFSLRSLAVIVTLLCVWLGIVANGAHRQRAIVESLRARGVAAYYDYQIDASGQPVGESQQIDPTRSRRFLGDDFCSTVVGVDFRNAHCDPIDDDMVLVGGLSALRYAQLTRIDTERPNWILFPSATRADFFEYLPGTPCRSEITELGLSHLLPLRDSLELLVIGGRNLAVRNLAILGEFARLRRLTVASTPLSEMRIRHELKQALPHCRVMVWNEPADPPVVEAIDYRPYVGDVLPHPYRSRYWHTTTLLDPLR